MLAFIFSLLYTAPTKQGGGFFMSSNAWSITGGVARSNYMAEYNFRVVRAMHRMSADYLPMWRMLVWGDAS